MTISANITVMTRAARAAAKGILRDFGEIDKLQISRKGIANFVTSADLRSEKVIIDDLRKTRPKFSILSEESGIIEGADTNTRFVIDPIDGTTNFIHAIPYLCTSIGLEKRNAEGVWETIAAVIYDPIHDELFHAEKNEGAFLNGFKIKTAERTQDVLLATAAPRKWKDNYEQVLKAFSQATAQATVRSSGSAALDLAYVAAGRIDGMWYHHLQWWDMSAGALMVREAGGIVTTLAGDSPSESNPSVVAASRPMHTSLLKLLTA